MYSKVLIFDILMTKGCFLSYTNYDR